MGLFSKDIAILDVTSGTVGAIIGNKKARNALNIKATSDRRHQGYGDGKWFDAADTLKQAGQALGEVIEQTSTRTKKIFISVPGEFAKVVTREADINLDKMRRVTDDDIDRLFKKGNDFGDKEKDYVIANTSAIYYSVDGEDKLYGDVRGVEANSVHGCLSYMLAEKSYVEMFDSLASDYGFNDIRYISAEWAECVGLLDDRQRENVFVLIDAGYISSSITIAKGEGILDMRSFSMGGGHIAGDICEFLGVSFEVAEEAKRLVDLNMRYGTDEVLISDGENVVYGNDAAALAKNRLNMFADIINGIFKEVENYAPAYMPIYLTGEGIAPMRGAKRYLSERINRNIEILTPKLPGYVKPDESTKAALIVMADTLQGQDNILSRIFKGEKR